MGRWASLVVPALLVASCTRQIGVRSPDPEEPPVPPTKPRAVSGPYLLGASGGARLTEDSLLVALERQRSVAVIQRNGRDLVVTSTLPLIGVAPGLDVESVARLPDQRFALGTEGRGERTHDLIYIAALDDEALTVQSTLRLEYESTIGVAENNRGIEGMCAAGPWLLAFIEPVRTDDGKRQTPLSLYHVRDRAWRHAWLTLTSSTGKVGAATCEALGDGRIAVFVIERHYEVMRIVRTLVDPADLPKRVESVVAAKVDEWLEAAPPNFEILERIDRDLVMVSDNSSDAGHATRFLMFDLGLLD